MRFKNILLSTRIFRIIYNTHYVCTRIYSTNKRIICVSAYLSYIIIKIRILRIKNIIYICVQVVYCRGPVSRPYIIMFKYSAQQLQRPAADRLYICVYAYRLKIRRKKKIKRERAKNATTTDVFARVAYILKTKRISTGDSTRTSVIYYRLS